MANVLGVGDAPLLASTPRAPLLQRVTPRQLLWVDLGVSGVLLVSCLWELGHVRSTRSLILALSLLAVVAVPLRRRSTSLSLGLMTLAVALGTAVGGSAVPDPLIALPMFQVAATRERGRSLIALFASGSVLLLGTAVGLAHHYADSGSGLAIAVAVAAWFVGDSVRVRRTYVAGLAEQAAQRQRETVERAQRSVAEERLRIARELHDVVAHSLSVIAVQSGVGRHVIDDNPAEAKRALGAVEATSRSALQELRRLLGILRSDGDEASLAPAPGLAGLEQLADQVRAAGVRVDLQLEATDRPLSPGAELSVYRVVQEALTNVVKHAGPASVHVLVRDGPDALVVTVLDDGCGPVPAPYRPGGPDLSGHHGIVGMRERVALFGGSFEAGFRPGGGFGVTARLPHDAVGL